MLKEPELLTVERLQRISYFAVPSTSFQVSVTFFVSFDTMLVKAQVSLVSALLPELLPDVPELLELFRLLRFLLFTTTTLFALLFFIRLFVPYTILV